MKQKSKAIWKEMTPRSRRRLAVAVFLMFSVMGPLTVLMESKLHIVSWEYIIIQTIACGALASGIILFAPRGWLIFLSSIFWTAVIFLNSGGISIVDNGGKVQTHLGSSPVYDIQPTELQIKSLTPDMLDAIYEQRTIFGLISIALIAVGYARFIVVIRDEVQERSRLSAEMTITKNIQQSLLPSKDFKNDWCNIAGLTLPATEVGGDYFDFVKLTDSKIAVLIADVAGHGVESGILSAMTKSAFYSELQHDPNPEKLLVGLNNTLFDVSVEKMFVTAALILLDSESKKAYVATAGHPPIFYRKKSTGLVYDFRVTNLALGLKKDSVFAQREIPFASGDSFLLYTDGVVEASDGQNEQFGADRLRQLFLKRERSPADMCTEILEQLKAFSRKENYSDDVTVVCIRIV